MMMLMVFLIVMVVVMIMVVARCTEQQCTWWCGLSDTENESSWVDANTKKVTIGYY